MQTLKDHYEYFKGQFIKWIISGELPIGLESHHRTLSFGAIGKSFATGIKKDPVQSVPNMISDHVIEFGLP